MLRPLFRDLIHGFVTLFNSLSAKFSKVIGERYQLTLPFATYAPWLEDQEFLRLYKSVEADSLTNIFQSWELWTLGKQMAKLPGDILEVGVWRGSTSAILGKAVQANPDAIIYCADSFHGLVKLSAHDPNNTDGELNDAEPVHVEEKMRRFGVENYRILTGVFPDDTGDEIADKQFSLCHVDVDTMRSAQDVFDWVWPRMLPGGVVIFQDYGFHRTPGIAHFVDSLRDREETTVVHNLNGNALVFRGS